jgi:cytochrome d ubiquinol oxidase subunit II
MNAMVFDLPLIWAGVLGIAVAMYVILDGFDLGIGLLFPFAQDEGERDRMMASIKPFWDGNETWLVLGGGGLLVAFPRAYAILMPALYLPIIVMLLGLIFISRAANANGTSPSAPARRLLRLPRGRFLAASSRASAWRMARSPAVRSIGRRRFHCCAGSALPPAMRCSARHG